METFLIVKRRRLRRVVREQANHSTNASGAERSAVYRGRAGLLESWTEEDDDEVSSKRKPAQAESPDDGIATGGRSSLGGISIDPLGTGDKTVYINPEGMRDSIGWLPEIPFGNVCAVRSIIE